MTVYVFLESFSKRPKLGSLGTMGWAASMLSSVGGLKVKGSEDHQAYVVAIISTPACNPPCLSNRSRDSEAAPKPSACTVHKISYNPYP